MEKELLNEIDPRKGDKYSPNLHLFLQRKDKGKWPTPITVFRDGDEVMWLGRIHDGEFIGCRLMSVLCEGLKAKAGCYMRMKVEEVPDFWRDYKAKGRCAIDPTHAVSFIGDEGRFKTEGKERACQWCGAKQTLKEWIEQVPRSRWEPTP